MVSGVFILQNKEKKMRENEFNRIAEEETALMVYEICADLILKAQHEPEEIFYRYRDIESPALRDYILGCILSPAYQISQMEDLAGPFYEALSDRVAVRRYLLISSIGYTFDDVLHRFAADIEAVLGHEEVSDLEVCCGSMRLETVQDAFVRYASLGEEYTILRRPFGKRKVIFNDISKSWFPAITDLRSWRALGYKGKGAR